LKKIFPGAVWGFALGSFFHEKNFSLAYKGEQINLNDARVVNNKRESNYKLDLKM
jgi:hypothetical protein